MRFRRVVRFTRRSTSSPVDRFGWAPDRIGFVTANGWDAAGAAAHGFAVAWLRPPGAVLPAVPASVSGEASWATVPGQFAPG